MLHERQRLLDVEIGVILLVVAGGADALDDAEGALVGNAVDGGLLEGGRRLHVVVARPVADLALHVGHRVALRRRRIAATALVPLSVRVARRAVRPAAAARLPGKREGASVRGAATLV